MIPDPTGCRSRYPRNFVSLYRDQTLYFATRSHAAIASLLRMGLRRLFTEHPASVGETYLQHFGVACSFSFRMILGGLACFIHALLPFLFVRTGSECVSKLYQRMVTQRRTLQAREAGPRALS